MDHPWTHGSLKVRTQEGTQVCAGEKPDNQGPPSTKGTSPVKPHARRTRIHEAGDAVAGSQNSITRAVRNLHLVDAQTAQSAAAVATPSSPMAVRRAMTRRPGQQPRRVFLQCAQWRGSAGVLRKFGPWPHDAYEPEIRRRHAHIEEHCQLAWWWCVWYIRSWRGNRCNHRWLDTATSDIVVGHIFQGRRQPAYEEKASGGASSHRLQVAPSPIPQASLSDDSPAPDRLVREVPARESDAELLKELYRASATPRPGRRAKNEQ